MRRMGKRLRRQPEAHLLGDSAFFRELGNDLPIAGRVHYHGDMGKVLRCCADHRRAADIDILHRFGQLYTRTADGLSKGIEINYEKPDRRDPLLGQLLPVLCQIQPGQQATVDLWMQRLNPPPENLGKAGHL